MTSSAVISGPQFDAAAVSCDASNLRRRQCGVDHIMSWVLTAEWLGLILIAALVSPLAWAGQTSTLHPHLLAAVLVGPVCVGPAILIARLFPGQSVGRHWIAVAQSMLTVVLIDATGGRIESHFHVFVSLAILAFYRDWKVLITASAATAAVHLAGGIWFPQAIYGVLTVSPWRWVEHAGWVIFEDVILILATRRCNEIALLEARYYLEATHDALTGLPNRRLLQSGFEQGRADMPGVRNALLFVDLDRFKHVNDTFGHRVGDRLLLLVADRLRNELGDRGLIARVGGDEFVALLSADDAAAVSERLIAAIAQPFHIDRHELALSACIGIALNPDHATDLQSLQECADRAMYSAKAQGRNRWAMYASHLDADEESRRRIERDLPGAAERSELVLHLQPIVDGAATVTSFEALVRWNHPVLGTLPPAKFIPLAEKTGAIRGIGDWVLREACRQCRDWQRPGCAPPGVAVNISAVEFEDADFSWRVVEIVKQCGLNPALLTIELTETALLAEMARASLHLSRLREFGIRISLDDFGTGYSSLSYLTSLPADSIKLDRGFISREFAATGAVLESMIALAHRLGIGVVAEGVETQDQARALARLQCDQFQGFHFGGPLPAPEALRLLEAGWRGLPEPADSELSVGACELANCI